MTEIKDEFRRICEIDGCDIIYTPKVIRETNLRLRWMKPHYVHERVALIHVYVIRMIICMSYGDTRKDKTILFKRT